MKKIGFQYAHQYLNISPSSGRAPPGAFNLIDFEPLADVSPDMYLSFLF